MNSLDKMRDVPNDNCLYLLERLSSISGFFACNGKLLYLVEDVELLLYESVETEYLSLQTHVHLHSAENDNSFSDGFYNMIIFKGEDNNPNAVSFINICSIHSRNLAELRFKDFFYSLISLFQLPSEQQFKNALGFYGELKFMQYIMEHTGEDISPYWHKSGSYSKYDFSRSNVNYEVKTILSSELSVIIKHSQLFNDNNNYLVVASCEKNDAGETIKELMSVLTQNDDYFNNINFYVNIAKELKRISEVDASTTRFFMIGIYIFEAAKINLLNNIPEELSNLSYIYDLTGKDALTEAQIKEVINSV